jgi:hypothetical protein
MAQAIDSATALGNPVEKPEQDEFNRAPFCAALADRIARLGNEKGAAVVGLYGKWGFGKSSMLNLIEDHLTTHHGDNVVVAKFNPWLFTDEEGLLQSFFEVLEPMRAPKPGMRDKLAKLSKKYGGQAGMVMELALGETAGKLMESVLKTPSLEDTNAALQQSADARTIVLLIDDLDRLDRAEVMLMLKLVRLNSNLPRVVYLLAFDDEIIAKTIGGAYGLDPEAGREFLEKIVQFPFAVPAIGEERLLAYVLRHAHRACGDAGVKVDPAAWDIYEAVCRKGFSARLRTPRQAIRYGAAMDFSLPMLAGEVDAVQQMIIEGLRLLYPELYAILRDRTGAALEAGNSGPLFTQVLSAMPGNEDAGRAILDALLDPNRPATDSPFFHRRYWQRYFEYAVRPDGIRNSDLIQLMARFEEPAPLAAECVRLVRRNADEFAGVVRDLAHNVDTTARLRWIATLLHASAGLSDIGEKRIWRTLAKLIAGLALGTDIDDLAQLELTDIEQVLTETCAIGMLPILWSALQAQSAFLQRRRYEAHKFDATPFDAAPLEKIITVRIETAAPAFLSSMLVEDSVGFDLFAYLRIYATPSFRSWIASQLRAEPARSVDIVRHLARDKLSQDLQFQRWIETTELAAILHAHFGESLPQEPRHPIDQIVALHGKYSSAFAG